MQTPMMKLFIEWLSREGKHSGATEVIAWKRFNNYLSSRLQKAEHAAKKKAASRKRVAAEKQSRRRNRKA